MDTSTLLCDHGDYKIKMEETKFSKADGLVRKVNPALADWLWGNRSVSFTRYWEIALAGLRGVKWADVDGMDLSDGCEVKTITITYEPSGSQTCNIGNLRNKTGTLLLVVYHPKYEEFLFYFIPNKDVKANLLADGDSLRLSFPKYSMPTGWQTKYRVSFETMYNRKSDDPAPIPVYSEHAVLEEFF